VSLATVIGLARRSMIALSSWRPKRDPASDVSAHSDLESSITHRRRSRRPQTPNKQIDPGDQSCEASDTKHVLSACKVVEGSSDQRWFGPCGTVIGARVHKARFRPLRRRTFKPSLR
jgi:hypothetical protein